MPAEWEPHRATWIAWPHHEPDWPGKLGPIPWVYAEIARVIAEHEPVEILCQSADVAAAAREALDAHGVRRDRVRLHVVPTDRVWLRDSAPTGVIDETAASRSSTGRSTRGRSTTTGSGTSPSVRQSSAITGLPRVEPLRPDTGERIVLEGGGIEVNGRGPCW